MRKVFISYNRADREWAEWIAGTLERAGYMPLLQAWHILPGMNFGVEMYKAASEVDFTIAVLSEQFLKSEFTLPEWVAAFVSDPTGQKRKLIPVRVGKCDPPGLLKPVVYIDLVDLDEPAAAKTLLNGLKPAGKPVGRIPFPGQRRPASTSSAPFPPSLGKSNDIPELLPARGLRIDFLASPRDVLCYFDTIVDLGRSSECLFSLPRASKSVSGRHAILYFEPDESAFSLKDEGAKNGTFINGNRLEPNSKARLRDSDIVELSTELRFRFRLCERLSGSALPPCGALVAQDRSGKELARYLLIPGRRLSVGSLPDCAIPVESVGPARRLGWIIRNDVQFTFEQELTSVVMTLAHGSEVSFGLSRVVIDFERFRRDTPVPSTTSAGTAQ